MILQDSDQWWRLFDQETIFKEHHNQTQFRKNVLLSSLHIEIGRQSKLGLEPNERIITTCFHFIQNNISDNNKNSCTTNTPPFHR